LIYSVLSVAVSVLLLINAVNVVSLPQWFEAAIKQTKIYDNEYVDPSTVDITFPKQKRNLIYIYLESMETTYLSGENGGGLNHNLIPELYMLAKDNINFSHNNDVGGWENTTDTGWTVASLVSQTSGVPLSGGLEGNSYGQRDKFLPGVTTLNDILKDEGYYQAFMVGSDAEFGGREKYFSQHGVDKIYDLYTARDDGIIPEDYFVWWGMEDKYLYEYAKQELSKISQNQKPFAFTMLTVDTHHIGGYKCDKCTDVYEEQYDNVISCASRQINEFVEWIKQQDFYENTTVIIVGDHCSMDAGYFSRNISEKYERHIYNCIINPAKEPVGKTKKRVFTPLDMFPTTLASIGCDIEGNRLGLGVNLFSPQKTLSEKYGMKTFNDELSKTSKYYLRNFMR